VRFNLLQCLLVFLQWLGRIMDLIQDTNLILNNSRCSHNNNNRIPVCTSTRRIISNR
jgi:hypothetical protein